MKMTYAIFETPYGYKLELYDRLKNCIREEMFATQADAKRFAAEQNARPWNY